MVDHTRLDLWWRHNVLLASWGQLGYPMPAGYPLHRRMSTQVTGTIDDQVMNHISQIPPDLVVKPQTVDIVEVI